MIGLLLRTAAALLLIVSFLAITLSGCALANGSTTFACSASDSFGGMAQHLGTFERGRSAVPRLMSLQIRRDQGDIFVSGEVMKQALPIVEQKGPLFLAERPGSAIWDTEEAVARLTLYLDTTAKRASFSSMWLRRFTDKGVTELHVNVTVYVCV